MRHIRRCNKKMDKSLKREFTSEQLLIWRKYPEVLETATLNKIPYAVVNRYMKRYMDISRKSELPGYYPKTINELCVCFRMYIRAYNAEITPDLVQNITKARVAYEIAGFTGLRKWFET